MTHKIKNHVLNEMGFILYIVFFFFLNSCKAQKTDVVKGENESLILATIDSVSLNEIKQGEKTNQSIFDYYKKETVDEVDIWSDKMFGRCCSEADMQYSELLYFEISTNTKNDKYPVSNLSDKMYRTTYAFKEDQNVEIYLKLKRNTEHHSYFTNLYEDEVLKPNDTILKPFKLSLVNGYTKSKEVFNKNGRVKGMKVFINNNYKNTVMLKDTPLVQEFILDFIFYKNDVIKLIPISYYKGSTYTDICISEIQSSLADITHPSLNKKYVIRELQNKKN